MTDKRKVDALVFIYDANSGKIGAFLDSARKVLMVGGCALCAITHGVLGEKSEWKECQAELGVPVKYLHRDEIPEHLHEMQQRFSTSDEIQFALVLQRHLR